jgi:hypothetical protein
MRTSDAKHHAFIVCASLAIMAFTNSTAVRLLWILPLAWNALCLWNCRR